jgi:hypothetical protein
MQRAAGAHSSRLGFGIHDSKKLSDQIVTTTTERAVNQPQILTPDYWTKSFVLDDSDIERVYSHLLEVETPRTASQIAQDIISYRVAQERNRLQQLLTGRLLYQPRVNFAVGDEIVFPILKYAHGKVAAVRQGYDPRHGQYDVISVRFNGRQREFAANLPGEHRLNMSEEEAEAFDPLAAVDVDELYRLFGAQVSAKVTEALESRPEFVRLGGLWFVKALMAEVNIGHLHLAEAILEVNEGGPMPTDEILAVLDMDASLDPSVLRFSLNHALANDGRFDEIGRAGQVAWFLRRLEPEEVQHPPERLLYEPVDYDRSLLSPQLLMLERELDDEWSELEASSTAAPTILSLTFPHRWAGTLPLSARTRPLFPTGISPRTRVVLVDEQSNDEVPVWVVQDQRYVFGLKEWYEEHGIPVGGFITLKPGPEPGVLLLDFDRRRPQREWVRLAQVEGDRLSFSLERRSIGCGYDDLLIVGTDYAGAVNVLARRYEAEQRPLSYILVAVFQSLSSLNPQETVHTKTLYSAVNMVRRVAPGPLFAELIRHPGFQPVGDHYWQYDGKAART